MTTLIALGAAAMGAGAVLLLDHWTLAWSFARRNPARTIVGAIVVVGGGLVALTYLGFVDAMLEVPLWASWSANRPQYYLMTLGRDAPLLWPLFPAAVLVSLFAHRRLTVFCVVALCVALAVHSLAASKTLRYVYYALPFLCVVWGCALSGLYSL